jgi:hypothetical protein
MIDKSEKNAAKKLNGQLSRGSGAVSDDADIRIPGFLIESKRRENIGNKIIFNVKFWEKLRKQAIKTNRMPLYLWHTNGQSFCISYSDVLIDMLKSSGKKIFHVFIEYTHNVNYIFKIEDYEKVYSSAYNCDSIPITEFYYERKIPMTIIDFDTFNKWRSYAK